MIEDIHRRHRWNVETQRRLDGHHTLTETTVPKRTASIAGS